MGKYATDSYKDALSTPNNNKELPLHLACSLNVDINVIRFLHKSYDKAIKLVTSDGYLPFHLAITDLSITEYLFDSYSKAIKVSDSNGYYPLHLAIRKGAPLDVITFLIEKYPRSVQKQDKQKMLSLHHAFINKISLSSIKHILTSFPEAIYHADSNDRLPFHLAFMYCDDVELIRFLQNDYSKDLKEIMKISYKRKRTEDEDCIVKEEDSCTIQCIKGI